MCLSGVLMLRGATVSLNALSPSLLCCFSVVIVCRFFICLCFFFLFYFFHHFFKSTQYSLFSPLFFCNSNHNERKSTIPDRHFTAKDYSLDKIVFGSIYRQEVSLEAALQIADRRLQHFTFLRILFDKVLYQIGFVCIVALTRIVDHPLATSWLPEPYEEFGVAMFAGQPFEIDHHISVPRIPYDRIRWFIVKSVLANQRSALVIVSAANFLLS